ncbi:putative Ig domain-containing protein, partial [Aestuariibaculum lutulentum]
PQGMLVTSVTGNSVTLSGTPQVAGSFGITVSAQDSSTGSGPFTITGAFMLNVSPQKMTLSPAGSLPAASSVSAYSQKFSASGGTAPYRFTIASGALPADMTLDIATGALTGT